MIAGEGIEVLPGGAMVEGDESVAAVVAGEIEDVDVTPSRCGPFLD